MNIRFRSNLDLHHYERWPQIDQIPPIGTRVVSNTGLTLQVCGVTVEGCRAEMTSTTVCFVDLHLIPTTFESVSEFEKWYRERKIEFRWRD